MMDFRMYYWFVEPVIPWALLFLMVSLTTMQQQMAL